MPLECRAVVAEAGPAGITVWSSTQVPYGLRAVLTTFMGLPESRHRVIAPDVGGGFGGKGHIATEEVLVPILARLRRPLSGRRTARST